MAGFRRQPNTILQPKPRNITIRRKSHANRPLKALMGPPRQIPRSPVSQQSMRTIAAKKVQDKDIRRDQRAIATQPNQMDVQDSKAPESSNCAAACHLRSYIRGAVLPGTESFRIMMQPRGQRSYLNWLQIPFNQERKIDSITKFSTGALRAGIDNYLSTTFFASAVIPSLISASESLSLPSTSQRRTPRNFEPERSPSLPTCPNNLEEIASWVVELPLRTVQRVIHLSHPETAKWCFDEVPFDEWTNSDMYQVYVWRRHPTTRMETIQDSLAVIVQAPWVLSWQDLQDVVECTNSPPQTNPYSGMSTSYLFKHRVWDLIRDTCQKLETRYFILTTYEGWVFGTFDTSNPEAYLNPIGGVKLGTDQYPSTVDSEDCWSKCFVSNVLDVSQRLPNIVEGVLYWVAASMKLEGSLSTEPNSSTTIKTEDVSVLHSPPAVSRPRSPSPSPSPRTRSNYQMEREIGYFRRRIQNRGNHSYSPYSRSERARRSLLDNTLESSIGPAATEGWRFRPRSLFMMVKHFMRWLTVQGRGT